MTATVRYGAAYLRSAWWGELRAAYQEHPDTPHACAVCGSPRFQLHHRTYERLGCEELADLIALCAAHHERLHRAHRTHQDLHPSDTLAAFTDAWVLIKRREHPNAPLPSLVLYGLDRARPGAPVAALAVGGDGPAPTG